MIESDREAVVDMMRTFYHSPAVWTNGSEEIYNNDITACVSDNPYAEGFIFENETEICGYGMVAKSFSTEFGKPCIWIEDLYLKPEHRSLGIGSNFLHFFWSRRRDLNPRPYGPEPYALPAALRLDFSIFYLFS